MCSLKITACLDLVETLGGKKKRLPSLVSGQQRLAVNVIVGLKCKCPFPFYDLLQEIEVSFKLPFAWVQSTWEFTRSQKRIAFS